MQFVTFREIHPSPALLLCNVTFIANLVYPMKNTVTMALCLALAACGGGGGSGTSGTGNPSVRTNSALTVSIDRTQLRFAADEGRGFVPQAVLASASGTYNGTVYTGALDLGTAIDRVTTELIGVQAKFTVYPKSNLPAGEYRGQVQLFACSDEKCATHFSGSPANVDYTITVRKGLTVSPSGSQIFEAMAGATATRQISVQLPPDLDSYNVTTPTWLRALDVTPTGFTLQSLPLPPGNWYGIVNITAAPGRSIDIPVSYVVKSDGTTITEIKPDVSSLVFQATASQVAAARVVNVVLPGWTNELSAEAVQNNGSNWLSVVKSADRQVTVTADATNLSVGNYAGKIVLRSGTSGVYGTVAEIPVSFTVGAPSWQISGKYDFSVGADTTSSQLSSDISIASPDLPGQSWAASTTSAWLKLLTTSGANGSAPLKVAVDTTELAKLENFTVASAEVNVTSASGKLPATKLTFTVDKRIPEVNFLSPSVRLAGEEGQVIVRGRGFDSIKDLQSSLAVNGATVQSVQRVNDTQLLMQVAAASSEANFSVKNAMGFTPKSAKLKVVPAQSYVYTAIATSGNKGAIVYDPMRQAVYAPNKALGTVMRFGFNNGTWDISAADLTTVESIQMAPDGSSLVATATSGKIALFNPDDLSLQASYNVRGTVGGYALNSLSTLAMLNDGKAVFQGYVEGSSGYTYFDLVTRKFGSYASLPSASYAPNPPAFSASGDGSRLLVGYPTNNASNALYYADAADGVVKLNGGGVSYWYEGAQSFNGERMTLATYQVRDRDFNLMGNLIYPQGYYGRTPVFAPDGMRLYVMAYPSTYNMLPRVFVFDTSSKSLTSTDMPLLGYFELPDYPTCNDGSNGCNTRAMGTIAPDGKTLFLVGDKNLLVVPVPTLLKTAAAASVIQRGKAGSSAVPAEMSAHRMKR